MKQKTNRVSFIKVCRYLWKHYGNCQIARLRTNSGYVVPKTYVMLQGNWDVFTRDKNLAEKKGYTYFEI